MELGIGNWEFGIWNLELRIGKDFSYIYLTILRRIMS